MHIAYVTSDPMPAIGGEWTFLSQMGRGLESRQQTVTILSPSQMPAIWMTVVNRLSQLIRIALGSWLWFFVQLALVGFFIRCLVSFCNLWDKVDVFDAQGPIAFLAILGPARRRHRPVNLTIHGYFSYESNLGSIQSESPWGRLLRAIERCAYERASNIVTVDSRLGEYVIRLGADPKKVQVRRNFIDCDVFVPADAETRSSEKARFGLESTQKVILCARRLEEKCGVAYAIQAVKELVARHVDVTLLIAGIGSLESELRGLATRLGIEDCVRFLGYVDQADMPKLLHASDAVVVPSVTVGEEVEATSFAALEAMASGLAVVASRIGGLEELITDGVSGILVPERDATALAEGLTRALGPEGMSIGEKARQVVGSESSLAHGVESTLSLYRELTRLATEHDAWRTTAV